MCGVGHPRGPQAGLLSEVPPVRASPPSPPPGLEGAHDAPSRAAPLCLEPLLTDSTSQCRGSVAGDRGRRQSAHAASFSVGPPPGLESPGGAGAPYPLTPASRATPLEAACARGAGLPAPFSDDVARGPANSPRGAVQRRHPAPCAAARPAGAAAPRRRPVTKAAPCPPQPPAATAKHAEDGHCSRHLKRRLRQALCSKRSRRVVLELFAGSAHLTEAVKRRGLSALALDLSRGAAEDHLSREFRSVLQGWLASRVAGAVWLGTPCTTWTQALRHPLRTRARPMGRADLLPHEAAKVRVGNRTFHFSCDVIELCLELRIPVFMENPAGSMIWKARRLQRLIRQPGCQLTTFDCCQYGSPWRKRTSVAAWGAVDLSRLQRRCAGRRGLCSRTNRPHVILTGHSDGVHLTAQAAAYPPPFCREVSKLIEHSMHLQSHRHLVRLMT